MLWMAMVDLVLKLARLADWPRNRTGMCPNYHHDSSAAILRLDETCLPSQLQHLFEQRHPRCIGVWVVLMLGYSKAEQKV